MAGNSLLDIAGPILGTVESLEDEILGHVNDQTVIGLDALIALLPQYSWNLIFSAVDDLARRRMIVLRRYGFEYTLFSNHYVA
jgi:hypothetical protein